MKKLFVFLLLIFLIITTVPAGVVFAEDKTNEQQLQEEVDSQLNDFNFEDLNGLFDNEEFKVTEEESFKDIVYNLVNGKYKADGVSILGKIVNAFTSQISSVLPIIIIIIAIAILSNIVNSFQPNSNAKSIPDIIHFVCIAVVIVLIVAVVKNIYLTTTNTIESISNQMSILFPILLTMMSAMGSVVTAGIYQPVVAVLTNGVTAIFGKVIYPIFILSFLFVILNSISSQVKLNKFISFLGSTFKWIVGFVFTIFAGLLTIQGISAGRYDTISLKATRFALKSYIPIIGGYLSEGLDYVLLSSLLIKNAIGVAGIVLLIMTILIPILNILALKLGLQFVAGVIEPIGNSKISNLCDDLSKVLVYPIVVILSVSFMYILSIGLIMCTVSGV